MQITSNTSNMSAVAIGLNQQKTQRFNIAQSAQFFQILSSSLYTYKDEAVIRETLTNAIDANIKAGKDQPVYVGIDNNKMVFIDFGSGINPDLIQDIYCTYGQSTKTQDETQTGGFGLGCKSPFAITDSFTLINRYQGKKYTYLIQKSALNSELKGIPTITLINEKELEPKEQTGIIVVIPYDSSKYSKLDIKIKLFGSISGYPVAFYNAKGFEVQSVNETIRLTLENANLLPLIKYTNKSCRYTIIQTEERSLLDNLDSLGHSRFLIKYGNNLFPIKESELMKANDFYKVDNFNKAINLFFEKSILYNNTQIVFTINEPINITPNRESVSYTPITQALIYKSVSTWINETLKAYEETLIECCKNHVKQYTNTNQYTKPLFLQYVIGALEPLNCMGMTLVRDKISWTSMKQYIKEHFYDIWHYNNIQITVPKGINPYINLNSKMYLGEYIFSEIQNQLKDIFLDVNLINKYKFIFTRVKLIYTTLENDSNLDLETKEKIRKDTTLLFKDWIKACNELRAKHLDFFNNLKEFIIHTSVTTIIYGKYNSSEKIDTSKFPFRDLTLKDLGWQSKGRWHSDYFSGTYVTEYGADSQYLNIMSQVLGRGLVSLLTVPVWILTQQKPAYISKLNTKIVGKYTKEQFIESFANNIANKNVQEFTSQIYKEKDWYRNIWNTVILNENNSRDYSHKLFSITYFGKDSGLSTWTSEELIEGMNKLNIGYIDLTSITPFTRRTNRKKEQLYCRPGTYETKISLSEANYVAFNKYVSEHFKTSYWSESQIDKSIADNFPIISCLGVQATTEVNYERFQKEANLPKFDRWLIDQLTKALDDPKFIALANHYCTTRVEAQYINIYSQYGFCDRFEIDKRWGNKKYYDVMESFSEIMKNKILIEANHLNKYFLPTWQIDPTHQIKPRNIENWVTNTYNIYKDNPTIIYKELLSVFEVHTSWFKNGSDEVQQLFYKYLNIPLPKAVKKFIYHHLLNSTALYSKLAHNCDFVDKVEDMQKLDYAYLKTNRYSCKTLNFLQKLNK